MGWPVRAPYPNFRPSGRTRVAELVVSRRYRQSTGPDDDIGGSK